jgi:type II secretory pathway pseudopilin PulG
MTLSLRNPRRRAVTLLEVMLVMGVLSILLGLLITSVQRAREAANVISCQTHLKDLALAVHNYETATGKMPPYASGRPKELYGSWYMHLLPYVGQQDLYEVLQRSQHTFHNNIEVVTSAEYTPAVKHIVFPDLVCESDPTRHAPNGNNTTNYLANWYALSDGQRGTYRRAQPFESLTNGLSNVILLAEGYSDCQGLPRLALYSSHFHNFGITQDGLPSDDSFYKDKGKDYLMFQENPSPKDCDKWRTQTAHAMMPVALADGSVRNVPPTISPHTWRHLIHGREGGSPGADW